MSTLLKILIAGGALFFVFGVPKLLKKGDKATAPRTQAVRTTASAQAVDAERLLSKYIPKTFSGTPDNLIAAVDWLQANAARQGEWRDISLTYSILPRSDRCQVDSLPACLQEKIREAKIDPVDFQFTYFFDQVFLSAEGVLVGSQKAFFIDFEGLRRSGWRTGFRDFSNRYTCSKFKYRSKYPLDFIKNNYKKSSIFTPIEQAPFPNGVTASGQPTVDWHAVSINPKAFPLSVPDAKQRQSLAQVYAKQGKLAPQPRSFIVIQAEDGRMFLTEAMDAGSDLAEDAIAWRIGNNSTEIDYFKRLGDKAKALCFILDDASVDIGAVLDASRQ